MPPSAWAYVHAQDRFWQMELMRRLGQGRLSELVPPALVGSGLIDTDRTMRGLGLYRHAGDSVNALSPGTRTMLEVLRRRRECLAGATTTSSSVSSSP